MLSRLRPFLRVCLVLLAATGLLAFVGWRMLRQARLDRALIAAIRNTDARSVETLLAQGADPNARDTPPPSGPFWRYFLERMLGRTRPPEGTPALLLAARADLDFTSLLARDRYDASYAVLRALHDAEAKNDDTRAKNSLDWAGRVLDEARTPEYFRARRKPFLSLPLKYRVEAAEEAFRAVVAEYGPSARAYSSLATARALREDRVDALRYARMAAVWSSEDTEVKRALREAEEVAQVQAAIEAGLERPERVLCLERFTPEASRPLWAALVGVTPDYIATAEEPSRFRLELYSADGKARVTVGPRPVLEKSFEAGSPAYQVGLLVHDLNRDGMPEIAVETDYMGASISPGDLDVFAWRGGKLASIASCNSIESPPWLEDVNGDGIWEIRDMSAVGSYGSHAGQVRWCNVYAYCSGRYVLDNLSYPQAFKNTYEEIRARLQEHPDDRELRYYLAVIQDAHGRKAEAARSYRLALPDIEQKLREGWAESPEEQDKLRQTRRYVRSRLAALAR